jgi:hypothetical protein
MSFTSLLHRVALITYQLLFQGNNKEISRIYAFIKNIYLDFLLPILGAYYFLSQVMFPQLVTFSRNFPQKLLQDDTKPYHFVLSTVVPKMDRSERQIGYASRKDPWIYMCLPFSTSLLLLIACLYAYAAECYKNPQQT